MKMCIFSLGKAFLKGNKMSFVYVVCRNMILSRIIWKNNENYAVK